MKGQLFIYKRGARKTRALSKEGKNVGAKTTRGRNEKPQGRPLLKWPEVWGSEKQKWKPLSE